MLKLVQSSVVTFETPETDIENEVDDYEFLFDEAAVEEPDSMTEDLIEQEMFELDEISFPEAQQKINTRIFEATFSDENDQKISAILEREPNEEYFQCIGCNEEFTSSVQLNFHNLQNHETVEKISETTIEKEIADQHKKEKRPYRQDNQGRFICHVCERTYSTRDILSRHLVKHSSKKDFKCNFCPRDFFFQRDLNVHLKQQHFDPKKFTCEVCNAEFTTNASRKKHLSLHLEKSKRKFNCDKCELTFKTKGVLKIHQRTHTGIKPFMCQVCPNGTAFTQKIILQRHMKNVHHENIYQCDWCNSSFEMHGHLREHWKECTNLRSRGNYEIVIVSNDDIDSTFDLQNETAVKSIEVDFDED